MPLRALKAPDFTRVMLAIRNAICAALLYWAAGRMSRKFSKLLPLLRKLPVVEQVHGIDELALGRHRRDRGGVGFRGNHRQPCPDQAPAALNVSEEGESHVQQMSPARY